MKRLAVLLMMILTVGLFAGCDDASIVSGNISREADQFRVYRRIVFYNSIQDVYILSIEGFCSINVDYLDNQLEVTVKIGEHEYQKHYLGLSDNVTYTVEQLISSDVSPYHYTIIFKPEAILPIILNESSIGD